MYELNKRAVQLLRSLLWDLWERITRGRNGVPGAVLGWGLPQGCILSALVRSRLPDACGLVGCGGEAYGMFERYKGISMGQVSGLFWVMTQCIVGDSFGCFRGFWAFYRVALRCILEILLGTGESQGSLRLLGSSHTAIYY